MKRIAKKYSPSILKFTLILTSLLLSIVPILHAQSTYKFKPGKNYLGMEGGFGVRAFDIKSDIPQLNNLTTIKGGGSLGYVFGNSIFKFPSVIGLYFESIEELQSIDLFTMQTGVNVSLLRLLGMKKLPVDIYTIGNIELQSFSFMGTYLNLPRDQQRQEVFGEPRLGNTITMNANLGLGIEIKVLDQYDFIHIFFESKKPFSLLSKSTIGFSDTSITNTLVVNMGVRVGTIR